MQLLGIPPGPLVGKAYKHLLALRMERLGPEPAHVADARMVIVGLSAYGGRPSRMPATMRDAILAFEAIGEAPA